MLIFYPYVVFADRTDRIQIETDRNPIRFYPFLSVSIRNFYQGCAVLHNMCINENVSLYLNDDKEDLDFGIYNENHINEENIPERNVRRSRSCSW